MSSDACVPSLEPRRRRAWSSLDELLGRTLLIIGPTAFRLVPDHRRGQGLLPARVLDRGGRAHIGREGLQQLLRGGEHQGAAEFAEDVQRDPRVSGSGRLRDSVAQRAAELREWASTVPTPNSLRMSRALGVYRVSALSKASSRMIVPYFEIASSGSAS